MSCNHALFGDEYALSALEQFIEGNTEAEANNSNDGQHTTLDESIDANLQKIQRRRRKAAPDDVQIMAEQYQKTKDERLWQKLQNRLYRPLLKYVSQMTSNQMLAEDAVAITFARCNERIHEYNAAKSKFSTWIWTIAYRQCLYDIKINNRIDTVPLMETNEDGQLIMNKGAQDYNCATDDIASNIDYYIIDDPRTGRLTELNQSGVTKRLYDVSINAISEIDNPVTKAVIEMKIIKDITIKEISEALNMTQSNVKNHLYKGKSELANKIKKQYPDLYELYVDVLYENSNKSSFEL